jgi:alpha-beta hydrolase superfamily lysophospholipase
MIPQRLVIRPGVGRARLWLAVALALAAAPVLAGCTVIDALRPLPPDAPRDAPIPPTLHFTMRDGTVLPARSWLPTAGTPCRGVILGLHGFADSRDAFELPGPIFAAAGYALYAPDQRGFGDTADRGHWAGTPRMVDDAAELVAQLRAAHPGLPVTVMGESMGGAVAMLLAARPGQTADNFVLLAPAVWGWGQLALPLAVTLRVTDFVAPAWAPDPSRVAEDIYASDNIDAVRRLGRDPLTIRRPRIETTHDLVDLMSAAEDAAPAVHGRVLILSGRRDMLVPADATAFAWSRLPSSVRRAFYPHGYHLLLRDNDRALVIADILAWLALPDAWLPSGADSAAAAWLADHAWQGSPTTLAPATGFDFTGARRVWPY